MSDEAKHTAGRVRLNEWDHDLIVREHDGRPIACTGRLGTPRLVAVADAARFVACWNALADYPDPAKVRDVVEAASTYIDCDPYDDGEAVAYLRLRAALDALKGDTDE